MIKKVQVILFLTLLFISIGVVCASDTNDTNIVCDEINHDSLCEVDVNSNHTLQASSHTVNNDNYNQYFDLNGNLVASTVNDGDTINLDGGFASKSFIFNNKINIVGTSTVDLKNSMITLKSGASGSTISNLKITNTNDETYGIFLNSASNCVIQGCTITNTGKSSYCICLANAANYNSVHDNTLKAYGITYGHGSFTRSTPPLLLSGSHYNQIFTNHVEADDANGIYLSSYAGGPLKGGNSNFNTIYDNTVHYNVLPTSWAYGIQVMGNNNTIRSNTVIGGYRGVSTSGIGNIIISNKIINLTGADYNHPGVESGGEYAIVASYHSYVKDNVVIGAKVISTGAGISAIDDSVVENNQVNVTLKGRGIVAGGSNVVIRNNIVFTESGSGIYEKDEGSGLFIESNNITSISGVGILIEKLSSKRMPSNVTILKNIVKTNNKYAIDASGVQSDTSEIDLESNQVYGKLINTPAGVIDTSKPTYVYKGKTINITPSNIRTYINDNGGLTSEVNDTDILNFEGVFSNEVIYITKAIKITGKNPIFYNTTFKITSGNVLIENLTIINKDAERVNAWGIFVNQASGVRILNNKISVTDPKAAYAIYVLESSEIDVFKNELTSDGDFLTFTLLSYASENCNFINNTIRTVGTGTAYRFSPEKCIDGNELVLNGKSYCIDGNELVIDGKSYCIDGNELVIDGKSYVIEGSELVIDGTSYCIDGNELVIDGKSYCIDGNELVIDGKSYGSEYSTENAHVVSEIYQTYGILLLYSSNNIVSGNNVNVTSKLNETHSTIGDNSSQNSIVGIDLYYNSHNNTFSSNTINIKGNDNYIYGMGVLGYFTGHTAPAGQGASENKFINNTIILEGHYCVEGIIIGDESENTLVEKNSLILKSECVIYGIYFEMSQKSTLRQNTLKLDAQSIYSIQGYESNDNIVRDNVINASGKQVYGILFLNGNNNEIKNNNIYINSTGEDITFINLDSINVGNTGIYLKANSTNNNIENNKITILKNYAVLIDNDAVDNTVINNYLDCEMGIGDDAVNNTRLNTVENNYKYIAEASINQTLVKYLHSGIFNITFNKTFDGAVVKFYDLNNEFLGQSTVSNASALFTYNFDGSYTPANYIFKAVLYKQYYKTSEFTIPVTVLKDDINGTIYGSPIIQGDNDYIYVKLVNYLGNPLSGAIVQFNRVSYSRNIIIGSAVSDANGIAKVIYEVPPSLSVGLNEINAAVSGLNEYNDVVVLGNLSVLPRLNLTITINPNIYTNGVLAALVDSNNNTVSNKKTSVKIGTVTYSITTNANGELILPANIGSGTFQVSVSSPALGKYNENSTTLDVKVVSPIVGGGDISLYYGNVVNYKVRILDIYGNPVGAGVSVVFNIQGKTIQVQTDGAGYATYSSKLGVGKHTITATYESNSISNNFNVKSILTAKNIVKKKSKKIKFSVKVVNKNGKAAKNKKVTFKIKNKKYKVKTNKKGVATLTLKNLKVGKHKITSSYGGCSIKNTITVKK